MKGKFFVFGCFIISAFYVHSQVSAGGVPPSFALGKSSQQIDLQSKKDIQVDMYIEDLMEVDEWSARQGEPQRIAVNLPAAVNIKNSGKWSVLPDGTKIWTLQIKASEAKALMLYYNDFYLPQGAQLFIYNKDRTQVLGAYTHATNPKGGLFATEFVSGDEVQLEYVASAFSDEEPRLDVGEVGYGYNASLLAGFIQTDEPTKVCMVNINCEEGDAWQNEKKGIYLSTQKVGSQTYICSGTLLNNTAEDFKPLVLTARHCGIAGNTIASENDMKQWQFYFNLERTSCDNGSLITAYKTITGCRLLANTGTAQGSDGMLLLLQQEIPEEYGVYYNGWNHSETAEASGVCIHHPNGDFKKISTYTATPRNATFYSTEFTGSINAHWQLSFSRTTNGWSITQGGSSGSPLFNKDKQVIGTLSGGTSDCQTQYAANGVEFYGKMSAHWDKYKTDSSTRMDVWLDPLNTKVTTLSGRYRNMRLAPLNLTAQNNVSNVILTWTVAADYEAPVKYFVYRDNVKIGETEAFSFVDVAPAVGSNYYSVSAVYSDGSESPFTSVSLLFVKYKAPTSLTAERQPSEPSDIVLTWKAPLYEQAVFWGTLDRGYSVGFKVSTPFWFGQYWENTDLTPFNNRTLASVRFVPMQGSQYTEILIIQDTKKPFVQNIENELLIFDELNDIKLKTPFTINASKPLIISVKGEKTNAAAEHYSALCDLGPAVDGKGNVFSVDGINWYKLYDEEEPDDFNYNFLVSAIVSSETGAAQLSQSSESPALRSRTASGFEIKKSMYSSKSNAVEVRSSVPAPFPEISKYVIYRNSLQKAVINNGNTTTYTDMGTAQNSSYYYEVTAIYSDNISSDKSAKAEVNPVGQTENFSSTPHISPTVFDSYVYLYGSEQVTMIEAVNLAGQICLTVHNPSGVVDVSSLKQGVYFFRIWVGGSVVQTVKAIKTR